MKGWPLLLAAFIWGTASVAQQRQQDEVLLIVGGNSLGYLAPCGCTTPMAGGIKRRAALIRTLAKGKRAVIVENGSLASGHGRQDMLKSEASVQILKQIGVTAISFGLEEARLSGGAAGALQQLSGGHMVCSSIEASETNEIKPWVHRHGLLIGSVDMRGASLAQAIGEQHLDPTLAARRVLSASKAQNAPAVLLLQGTLAEAKRIAESVPGFLIIVFQSMGGPPSKPERVGSALLVSPGSQGLHELVVSVSKGSVRSFKAIEVGWQISEDPDASRIYRDYLLRVSEEDLMAAIPRRAGDPFAGSATCGKCHTAAHKVWQASRHAKALQALEKVGHGRDPECVSCHVVGLSSEAGFRSRKETPGLADVGCESCHGPGAAHSAAPANAKMSKAGSESCAPCHRPEHSPEFVFPKFWKSVAHK